MDDGVKFRDRMDIKKYFEERGFNTTDAELYDCGHQIGICIYKGDRANPEAAHCVRSKLPANIWGELAWGLVEWYEYKYGPRSLP